MPLPRLVADALALVACLARVGLAGLLGAPAYGKRLDLNCADPRDGGASVEAREGRGRQWCGDGDGERHAPRRPVGSCGLQGGWGAVTAAFRF